MLNIEFSKVNGAITSLCNEKREFLSKNTVNTPLICFRILSIDGTLIYINSNQAKSFEILSTLKDDNIQAMRYRDFTDYSGLCCTVYAKYEGEKIIWNIDVENKGDATVEYIAYPCIYVENNLIDDGGNSYILYPYTEGCLVTRSEEEPIYEDSNTRLIEEHNFRKMYPGGLSMQFMGYFDEKGGIYFAAHDISGTPKGITCYKKEGRIELKIANYFAIEANTVFRSEYSMVIDCFCGDWYDCAEKYRNFIENSEMELPDKIYNNKLPEWYYMSPIIVIFGIRGIRGANYWGDTDLSLTKKTIALMEKLMEKFNSKILTFLAYWEGSAPWCSPNMWPPYGGSETMIRFVEAMHEKGNAVGLYGSGLCWAEKSGWCSEFDISRKKCEPSLTDIMSKYPNQEPIYREMDYRTDYTMCVNEEKTKEITVNEIIKILNSNADFIQYFDQDIGGGTPIPCYHQEHDHPYGFGKWATSERKKLYNRINDILQNKCLLGTESAPADCFIKQMPLNDLRFFWGLNQKPVPVFEYVFHEYSVNFLGNGTCTEAYLPHVENPLSVVFRIAYSFVAGDLLSVVIKPDGEFHWEWGMSQILPSPDQDSIAQCIKNYNELRKGRAYRFLHLGKMVKPNKYLSNEITFNRSDGSKLSYPSVLSTAWVADNGDIAQVFANYTYKNQSVRIEGIIKDVMTENKNINFIQKGNYCEFWLPPFSGCIAHLN